MENQTCDIRSNFVAGGAEAKIYFDYKPHYYAIINTESADLHISFGSVLPGKDVVLTTAQSIVLPAISQTVIVQNKDITDCYVTVVGLDDIADILIS